MSESLTDDELAELIRNGRINTSKSAAKKRSMKSIDSSKSKPKQQSPSAVREPSRDVVPTMPAKELDPEWLEAEKERAERNIASALQDKRRTEEMRDASKF